MPCYAFGPFVLDPKARVLRRNGESVPLAGKTLDTLILLLENRGLLVDKDELLSRIWAGSVVEEANLTQAIFTVRKILGDNPKDHRYIATVAGRGYQFVAPVTEVPAEAPHASWRRSRILLFGAASGLLATLFGIGLWQFWPSHDDLLPEPIPLTSDPGLAEYPAFSPDGNQIAYSWAPAADKAANIYVKQIGSETKVRVTNSPGIDVFPAWSPDGRYLAFYRDLPGHSGYYMISALGGPERLLLRANRACWDIGGVDWFPDGRHVAVVVPVQWPGRPGIPPDTEVWNPHRIVRLDIETGEQVPLTAPLPSAPCGDGGPRITPNGKFLAFVRINASDADDIYALALDGKAQPRRLTSFGAEYRGLAWAPDNHDLVFLMYQGGRGRLERLPLNGGAARPITSTIEDLHFPAVARRGNRLAYTVHTGHVSLWRADFTGLRAGRPEPLIESTSFESQPAYSRDGTKLAWASNRSGPIEIWAADADGKNAVQLTNCGGPNNGTPRWSPDGSAIAFDTRIHGNPEIMIVTAEGHRVRQITHNPAEDVVPSWSNDGRWIYFASNRNGGFQIYKVPASEGESPSTRPVQVTTGGGFNAMESPDGKYLYFARGRGKRGLWRRPLDGSRNAVEEPVLESLQYWGWWALGPNGIYFLEKTEVTGEANWYADAVIDEYTKVHLKFLDLASKRITDLASFEYPLDLCTAPMAISPDAQHIVFEQAEDQGSSIVLLENFR